MVLTCLAIASPASATSWGSLWERSVDAIATARKIDSRSTLPVAVPSRFRGLGGPIDDLPRRLGTEKISLPASVRADGRLAGDLQSALRTASEREAQGLTYLLRLGDDALRDGGARVLPVLRTIDSDDAKLLVVLPQRESIELLREQGLVYEAAARAFTSGNEALRPVVDGRVSLLKAYAKGSSPVLELYDKYVSPHLGKWIAGGALVAFLASPDRFIDGAGRLTEHAVAELGRLGIAVAGGVTSGLEAALRRACLRGDGQSSGPLCALLPAATFILNYVAVPFLLLLALWAVGAALTRRFAWFFAPIRGVVRLMRRLRRPGGHAVVQGSKVSVARGPEGRASDLLARPTAETEPGGDGAGGEGA